MARKPSAAKPESHDLTAEQTPAIEAAAEAANQMALLKHQYNDERDLANQLLGQAQMANAISKFSDVVTLSKLKQVHEGKLYRALAGKTVILPSGENLQLVGTFEEFCKVIGLSYSKVNEDLKNLDTFGEEALQGLSQIGVGYRELRQYRKLPADERLALIEAAKDGDKEGLIDLAETLITKHAKEKEALEKANAELKADYEAQSVVLEKRGAKLNSIEKQLHKLQNRAEDWHPRATEIAIETTRHAAETLGAMDKLDTMRDAILTEDFGEDGVREAAIEAMAVVYYDAITQIVNRVAELADACEEVFIGYKEKARPMLDVEAFQPKADK